MSSEDTMQYTDDVLQNCTLETYRMLLTSVTHNQFNWKQNKTKHSWIWVGRKGLPTSPQLPGSEGISGYFSQLNVRGSKTV